MVFRDREYIIVVDIGVVEIVQFRELTSELLVELILLLHFLLVVAGISIMVVDVKSICVRKILRAIS